MKCKIEIINVTSAYVIIRSGNGCLVYAGLNIRKERMTVTKNRIEQEEEREGDENFVYTELFIIQDARRDSSPGEYFVYRIT